MSPSAKTSKAKGLDNNLNGTTAIMMDDYNGGEWRPRYWTIACVGTVHLLCAAIILTATPTPMPPPVLNSVDVVTFSDGQRTRTDAPSAPVDLAQDRPDTPPPLITPQNRTIRDIGPQPIDKSQRVTLPEDAVPRAADALSVQDTPPFPPPVPANQTIPAPSPLPLPTSRAVPEPEPVPTRQPSQPLDPVPDMTPTPQSVQLKSKQFPPALEQPAANPLVIGAEKLKLKQAPALKPVRATNVPAPSPLPKSNPTPAPPPATTDRPVAPLNLPKSATQLPNVQLPRVNAPDLRLPDVQADTEIGNPASPTTGVTSVSAPAGQGANGRPTSPQSSNGAGANGAAGSNGAASPLSGTAVGGGNSGAATVGSGAGAGAGAGGPSGVLPRRPGGASVREAFPRGNSGTIIGKMDKTYDCSRLNRERDARCPNWDPIEGRNSQGLGGFEVPVPKGLPKLRNPIGTNPLPLCPRGTPGSQFGLSCLPSNDGPVP
jgi:hypothetical protein